MKYSIKFQIVKQKNFEKNCPIRIRVTYSGVRVELRLGLGVPFDCWVQETESCKAREQSQKKVCMSANRAISDFRSDCDKLFARCELMENRPPTTLEVKSLIGGKSNFGNKVSEVMEMYLKDATSLAYHTQKVYRTAMHNFITIVGDIGINEITEQVLKDFERSLSLTLKNSSTKSLLVKITALLRWAKRQNLYTADGLNYSIKLKNVSKTIIYLTREELLKFYDYHSENKAETAVKDMYCFCAFTGLRHSDMVSLTWDNVHDTYIDVVTQKTTDNLRIELNEYSQKILDKYRSGADPSGRVFPRYCLNWYEHNLRNMFIDLGFNTPVQMTYYQGNERKTVTVPKYEVLTSHTARKTFVVNAIRLGIPLEVLMRWTGHKSLTSIKPYLKIVDEVKEAQMKKFNNF